MKTEGAFFFSSMLLFLIIVWIFFISGAENNEGEVFPIPTKHQQRRLLSELQRMQADKFKAKSKVTTSSPLGDNLASLLEVDRFLAWLLDGEMGESRFEGLLNGRREEILDRTPKQNLDIWFKEHQIEDGGGECRADKDKVRHHCMKEAIKLKRAAASPTQALDVILFADLTRRILSNLVTLEGHAPLLRELAGDPELAPTVAPLLRILEASRRARHRHLWASIYVLWSRRENRGSLIKAIRGSFLAALGAFLALLLLKALVRIYLAIRAEPRPTALLRNKEGLIYLIALLRWALFDQSRGINRPIRRVSHDELQEVTMMLLEGKEDALVAKKMHRTSSVQFLSPREIYSSSSSSGDGSSADENEDVFLERLISKTAVPSLKSLPGTRKASPDPPKPSSRTSSPVRQERHKNASKKFVKRRSIVVGSSGGGGGPTALQVAPPPRLGGKVFRDDAALVQPAISFSEALAHGHNIVITHPGVSSNEVPPGFDPEKSSTPILEESCNLKRRRSRLLPFLEEEADTHFSLFSQGSIPFKETRRTSSSSISETEELPADNLLANLLKQLNK